MKAYHISNIYVKQDLALNNPQWFISDKIKPNQTKDLAKVNFLK